MKKSMLFKKSELSRINKFIYSSEIDIELHQLNNVRNGNEVFLKLTLTGNENNIQIFFRDLTAFLN